MRASISLSFSPSLSVCVRLCVCDMYARPSCNRTPVHVYTCAVCLLSCRSRAVLTSDSAAATVAVVAAAVWVGGWWCCCASSPQDLEENPELRGEIDLYKDPSFQAARAAKAAAAAAAAAAGGASTADDDSSSDDDDDDDEDFPEIQLSELLDSVHLTNGPPADGFVSGLSLIHI